MGSLYRSQHELVFVFKHGRRENRRDSNTVSRGALCRLCSIPREREIAARKKPSRVMSRCISAKAFGGSEIPSREMAAHESPHTTKLYDRTKERLTQDEVKRLGFSWWLGCNWAHLRETTT